MNKLKNNNMEQNELILKALYEQKKLIILQSYKNIGDKTGFSESYIYAIEKDIFPFFHLDISEDIEIYRNFYKIKEERVREIVLFISDYWNTQKTISFYELEKQFGGKEQARWDLIEVLNYCFLDNRFVSRGFIQGLLKESEYPMEAECFFKFI